jgi:hypothetical protein
VSDTGTIVPAAMLEFLRWVACEQRSYADAMEVWQTSCPRQSVWEDASIAGYIVLRRVGNETIVTLTPKGKEVSDPSRRP